MKISVAAVFATAFIVSGCYTVVPAPVIAEYSKNIESKTLRLSAVGYGAASAFDGYSIGQKRLLAMRASKLDAYRSLAEQVYGIRITGNTMVSAMAAQNDSFRAYIDAYLRGARILSVTPMADGNYETVIEMDFDERIVRNYLVQAPATVALVPVNYQREVLRGVTGSGSTYGTSFYYAD